MPLRRRAWLTPEGWYYLAVLVFIIGGAVLRSVNLLVILAGTMIAPLLFNWRLVMASLMDLRVRRKLPEQIIAGDPLTVEIEVENPRPWMSSWLVTVADRIERVGQASGQQGSGQWPGARGQGPEIGGRGRLQAWLLRLWRWRAGNSEITRAVAFIPHVPSGGRAMGLYRITLFRRGRYRFGPLIVATRFPLGLVRGHFVLPERSELLVAPRLGRLLPQWAALLEAELVGEERRHPQRGINEGDYYGLRPWQAGDSLRWIHWRTSARLGRPIVRQFERRRGRDVAIVLDPWLPAAATERHKELVELAISLAATAVSDITRRGHSLLSIAIAGQPPLCVSGSASEMFCQELLAHLAELAPGNRGDLTGALAAALEAAPHGARLLIVSSRPPDDPSLAGITAELAIDPQELTWIDAGSPELASLFVFAEL
jgi:uncharacterized protein (DUF58 family)